MIRHCIISIAHSGGLHKVATFELSVSALRERIWPRLLSSVGTWRLLFGSNTLYLTYREIALTARMQRGNGMWAWGAVSPRHLCEYHPSRGNEKPLARGAIQLENSLRVLPLNIYLSYLPS